MSDMQSRDIERVARWASIECEKQRSGERSVGRMVEGWVYAIGQNRPPNANQIQHLGFLVEPRTNTDGRWRKTQVRVGMSVKPDPAEVPRLMDNLINAWADIDADAWYREFEEVHPFGDGNGRTGNILWNWHRGTLTPDRLEFPPDYWGYDRLTFTESAVGS